MSLSADTKHALRNALGHQAGTEMISAIDGLDKTQAGLVSSACPSQSLPAPARDSTPKESLASD